MNFLSLFKKINTVLVVLLLGIFLIPIDAEGRAAVNDNDLFGVGGDDGSFSAPSNVNSGPSGALVDCKTAATCTFDEFTKTFSRIVDLLLATAVAMSTIIFVYAGFLYLTAADNAGKRSQANKMIWNAVIGFFIAAAAWLLVEVFINTLEGNKNVIKVDEFNIDKN